MMKITRTSIFSGVSRTLDIPVTEEQLREWNNGMLIQEVMPNLSADQREFLITGITAEEWAETFGEDE